MRIASTPLANSRNVLELPPADVGSDQDAADDDDGLEPEVELDDLLVQRRHGSSLKLQTSISE